MAAALWDGGGDLEAGQHQELSGETTVGVSSFRSCWLKDDDDESEVTTAAVAMEAGEVQVVIVVSR